MRFAILTALNDAVSSPIQLARQMDVPIGTVAYHTRMLLDLADFVRVKGGGLLVLAGENAVPAAFAETPLADVLPIVPTEGTQAVRTRESQPITEGYRPKLTPAGQLHPLFRFSTDDAESSRIWGRLQPLFWYAKGYKRKLTAEVLAFHPDRGAEGMPGEHHPLVLQQFSGSGRVLFLGFDETWRWRWRNDEEQFNRFWCRRCGCCPALDSGGSS